jgi:hypothetical protein
MGGVGGIAHQGDMAAAVEMMPMPADQPAEIEPGGAAQMARVGLQPRPCQSLGEERLAEGDGLVLVGRAQAMGIEGLLRRLDDEGRGIRIESVDMGLEPTMLGLAEVEGEGSKFFFVPSQMKRFGRNCISGRKKSS